MELSLGTVQFGVVYGLSGATTLLSDQQVREILELAFERGIRSLDTAPAYGDIESRLGGLCEGLDFQIVSKISAIPGGYDQSSACQWSINSATTSRERLGQKLKALLFHRAEDLTGERGSAVWSAAIRWASASTIALGASAYEADVIRAACRTHPIAIAQLPGSALDQRFRVPFSELASPPRLQLRSAFLQGLLLLPVEVATQAVRGSSAALQKWHAWLKRRALPPMQGAFSIVKAFEGVETCVVGVDNLLQLRELTDAWAEATPICAGELACDDLEIIDPRKWSRQPK